ncbi:MAG: hypothetical protein ACI4SF_10825 [Oscillospiraceae bacterium]
MTKKKKVLLTVLLAIAAYIVLSAIYDNIFPALYIRKKYPDFQIVEVEKRKGSISFFYGPSDPEMRYLDYDMYDPNEDISFTQTFAYSIFFPFYKAYDSEYEEILKAKILHEPTAEEFEDALKRCYSSDYILVSDPFQYISSNTGFLIFIRESDTDALKRLTDGLDRFVLDYYRNRGMEYVCYSIFICTDDDTYQKLKGADMSNVRAGYNGQAYFSDIIPDLLDCEATRITASNDGFSEKMFLDIGDKADDEYQPPENFDTVMFWYDGEPNAAYDGHFYLFGLNFEE